MRTKSLCTSCEQYVYTDTYHSCYDAKALRALRDAEAAVVEAAEAEFLAFDAYSQSLELRAYTDDVFDQWEAAHRRLHASVTALHAARQGDAS
jgi:hypothetical protein